MNVEQTVANPQAKLANLGCEFAYINNCNNPTTSGVYVYIDLFIILCTSDADREKVLFLSVFVHACVCSSVYLRNN